MASATLEEDHKYEPQPVCQVQAHQDTMPLSGSDQCRTGYGAVTIDGFIQSKISKPVVVEGEQEPVYVHTLEMWVNEHAGSARMIYEPSNFAEGCVPAISLAHLES